MISSRTGLLYKSKGFNLEQVEVKKKETCGFVEVINLKKML